MHGRGLLTIILVLSLAALARAGGGAVGYYRQPALVGSEILFVSEGDLWKVATTGGVATRLTTHHGEEGSPAVSPDGKTLAFVGTYDGQREVYTMPLEGGVPRRRTFGAAGITSLSWTPDGAILYSTTHYSTLPSVQLVRLDLEKGVEKPMPLAQAADGSFGPNRTLYFTRLPFQGSHTKRYQGGTAQNLWKFTEGDTEAVPLTANFKGTSKMPLYWQERVYFVSDRDGTMNLWSMPASGNGGLKQHTKHKGWDVASPSLRDGKIVYQLGADVHLFDIAADTERKVPITLRSDFDQTRETYVKRPIDYATSAHLSPDGDRVVLTARGRVYVVPHRQGRLVEAGAKDGVRLRNARFLPDGKNLVALSDESGEVELWTLAANGVGAPQQWTDDGDVLRWEAIPSPNGKFIAHHDKSLRLFLYDVAKKKNIKIDHAKVYGYEELSWSHDGQWLAYVAHADNMFRQIKLFSLADGKTTTVTSDRYDSYSPAWSADGKWLYMLSDRNLKSIVPSPWGNYQPEPFLDKKTQVYHVPLMQGLRSPFLPPDETQSAWKEDGKDDKKDPKKEPAGETKKLAAGIDLDGIQARLEEVPVPAGNYRNLVVNDKAMFFLSRGTGEDKSWLMAASPDHTEPKTIAADVKDFEMSRDGRKLLLHKGTALYIVDAFPAFADLTKKDVNLDDWSVTIRPREEWRQMFIEAWRLERDYFYDRGLHGVDWKAMLKKYLPLVERVHSREELSDLLAQMVSELSALHIFVQGGDLRKGPEKAEPASLGALLVRDPGRGGYRVERIYQCDPDEPDLRSPLARPQSRVKEGEIIETINGTQTLAVADIGQLLRRRAGQQVLLRVQNAQGKTRDVIVRPMPLKTEENLRYHEWEHTRRLRVEELGKGDLGYVHLRAMGSGNFTEFAKNYYPVFNRKGLIIDVRHNRGGNIDSWILGRLLRKAWFHWNQPWGTAPSWNMQYAFRGHMVVLCNEFTASDGEAFAEGFRRLGLGKVIGTRTWGGEIWLTFSNVLVDKGIASAAEFGVYGPEGTWLIEGHGVDPDIVVDNLPHATFKGEDAQLQAAIAHLQQMLRDRPITLPPPPPFLRIGEKKGP